MKQGNIFSKIEAKTICGKSSLVYFVPDELEIEGKKIAKEVCVAVTNANLNRCAKCNCLLHPKIFVN